MKWNSLQAILEQSLCIPEYPFFFNIPVANNVMETSDDKISSCMFQYFYMVIYCYQDSPAQLYGVYCPQSKFLMYSMLKIGLGFGFNDKD